MHQLTSKAETLVPHLKEDIDTILFWKERHYSVIQSFYASKNKGVATPIRYAREALGSIMKSVYKMEFRLHKLRKTDQALANSMSTVHGADVDAEIAKKLKCEAQVY